MGDPDHHRFVSQSFVHLRDATVETDWTDGSNIGRSGSVRTLYASAAICLRSKFSDGQVSAITEQDLCDSFDCGCDIGSAHSV